MYDWNQARLQLADFCFKDVIGSRPVYYLILSSLALYLNAAAKVVPNCCRKNMPVPLSLSLFFTESYMSKNMWLHEQYYAYMSLLDILV